jgi:hypothetical protein
LSHSEVFERVDGTGAYEQKSGVGLAVDFDARKQIFGLNVVPPRESATSQYSLLVCSFLTRSLLWKLGIDLFLPLFFLVLQMMLEALKDKTLILLMVAAALNLGFGIYEGRNLGS